MRTSDSLREELSELDSVIGAFGPRESLAAYPGALANLELLETRRVELVRQLADTEISALTLLLEGPGVVGAGDVDVNFLVSTLGPLQATISSVGQALIDRPTERAPIPGAVRSATQLRLVGTFPGSFGLSLAGPPPVSVQGDFLAILDEADVESRPVFERSVSLMLDVFEKTEASLTGGSTSDEILSLLSGLGSRAHAHLRSLVSALVSSDAAARFTFNPPFAPQRSITLRRPGAERLRRVLDESSIEESELRLTGRLAGASTIRDNFELETTDGTVIRGKVDDNIRPLLREFFDSDCTVTLRVRREWSPVDAADVMQYVLIGIR